MTSDPLTTGADARPVGIEGYPGPFAVGRYAAGLRDKLREFAHVCVLGEATGVRFGRGPNVYFELRDGDGGLPCAMWRDDFERAGLSEEDFRDGVEVVAAGGCDFYTGGASASPRFTFRVKQLRLAGEGDLLARLERLRRRLAEEGLFERQKLLPRAALPRRIGVVTAETGAARRDFLAGLERRGWRGTIVWGYAPVQDRRAAGAITQAIQDLAAEGDVDTIVVTRGGGSIADLWAFCDETLCRTVALLRVPVISAVGHHVDRTLIDDVAAVCCSTPTHAAEAAVAVDCIAARRRLLETAVRLDKRGRAAVLDRARALAAFSRAPRERVAAHRTHLRQKTRELRAASRRGQALRLDYQRRIATAVIGRKRDAAAGSAALGRERIGARAAALARAADALERRRREALRAHAAAIRGHDPERALERGYAIALDADGRPLASAAAVREASDFELRMADGGVPARVREEVTE
ncbi:MAG TPA: exodeoxyribonuclease VII large subunit [Thermoleophilaceae bacterium]|jgi:exodeoxyribonuclease VII large subunit